MPLAARRAIAPSGHRLLRPPDLSLSLSVGPRRGESPQRSPSAEQEGDLMADHVYKTIELVGSSNTGVEDAVQSAIAKAAATVRNLRWFEVCETRGQIADGRVAHWQVTLKVGFTLE
jgi:flavin-binding protein dodecin